MRWTACSTTRGCLVPRLRWQSPFASTCWQACRGLHRPFRSSLLQADPYRAPMKDYTWGSNKGKAMQARLYQLAALHDTDPRLSETSLAAALEYAHYIHGVNPLGLVYLTNMAQAGASHSAATMFHAWFATWHALATGDRAASRPAAGLSGRRTQSAILDRFMLQRACRVARIPVLRCADVLAVPTQSIAPPLEQPPAKSYLQYNDPWPANSWAIYGAFAVLPVLLCSVACRLYPLTRR